SGASSASSNGCTPPRNTKAPALAWPSSGKPPNAWAAESVSNPPLGRAASSGSNCRGPKPMTRDAATILVVEDDPNDVFFIQYAFERAGIKNPLQSVEDG